jgi:hypothetical protein
MKDKDEKNGENRDIPRKVEEQNQCDHDFQMLDLGTGFYDFYVCTKCGLDRKDWENE